MNLLLDNRSGVPIYTQIYNQIRAQISDGSLEAVAVERHLPGDREFYRDAMNCKFFKRAFERGLELKSVKFGMDKIMVLDIRRLYETGMAVIKDDPKVLLCDNPNCAFCATYR